VKQCQKKNSPFITFSKEKGDPLVIGKKWTDHESKCPISKKVTKRQRDARNLSGDSEKGPQMQNTMTQNLPARDKEKRGN